MNSTTPFRDNANCIVSIWDDEKQWIEKEDTGTESFTEAEKGLAWIVSSGVASNWGIGRELYTAPFIWVDASKMNIIQGKNGRLTTRDKFKVEKIVYDDNGDISGLSIQNQKNEQYLFGKKMRRCYICGFTQEDGTPSTKNWKEGLYE